jgi:hypothetical protein
LSLSAVSDLQPLHDTRHAALPGLFAEQGSLQFLVAHAAGDAGARIIPARRQASGTLTGHPAQAASCSQQQYLFKLFVSKMSGMDRVCHF